VVQEDNAMVNRKQLQVLVMARVPLKKRTTALPLHSGNVMTNVSAKPRFIPG